jgi:hypothetical protein
MGTTIIRTKTNSSAFANDTISYPHLFVLDQDGMLLHSQDTSVLEEGPSYNLDKMTGFLKKWAPR